MGKWESAMREITSGKRTTHKHRTLLAECAGVVDSRMQQDGNRHLIGWIDVAKAWVRTPPRNRHGELQEEIVRMGAIADKIESGEV
jgi:hypothetical protein